MREGLSGLGSEGEGEGWDEEWTLDPPRRVRRTRESALTFLSWLRAMTDCRPWAILIGKSKKQARKKVHPRRDAAPVDPYAPSTSAVAL